MSSITPNKNSINPSLIPPAQPAHHLHSDSEPLLDAKGVAATNDYTASTTEQNPSFALRDEEQSRQIAHAAPPHVQGKSTFSSERPLDVKPTTAGGVAIGGCSDLSMGRAGLGDKMIGKTQKVVGKVTNNSEMHEKGELRESGAKAAAHKEARVAHD